MTVARNNLPIIQQSEKLQSSINGNTLLKIKRQPQEHVDIVNKCDGSIYKTSAYINTGYTLRLNRKAIYLNANLTCKSRNHIYAMNCGNCNET